MAVLSRPWPFYQGRSSQVARHPDFGRGLQSRAISLSAAGPSYFQQKQVQWPFYQREAQWPLSKQKQPDGQTSRFQRQIAILVLSRTISLSAAGPSYSQQKQAQWPFYQREAQWPFYQSRSNRMARPPDFSDKLQFWYYPAQSVYQRPAKLPMAVLSKQKQPDARANMELAIRGSSLATWLLLL